MSESITRKARIDVKRVQKPSVNKTSTARPRQWTTIRSVGEEIKFKYDSGYPRTVVRSMASTGSQPLAANNCTSSGSRVACSQMAIKPVSSRITPSG